MYIACFTLGPSLILNAFSSFIEYINWCQYLHYACWCDILHHFFWTCLHVLSRVPCCLTLLNSVVKMILLQCIVKHMSFSISDVWWSCPRDSLYGHWKVTYIVIHTYIFLSFFHFFFVVYIFCICLLMYVFVKLWLQSCFGIFYCVQHTFSMVWNWWWMLAIIGRACLFMIVERTCLLIIIHDLMMAL